MKIDNTFQYMLSDFFLKYIPSRNLYSPNTIKAYRDTFILLCQYHKESLKKPISRLKMETINEIYVNSFLVWLETNKNYSAASLNQRLAGIHAFFRYVQSYAPEYLGLCQSVLNMRYRRVPNVPMNYLTIEAIKHLLTQPTGKTKEGIRDLALLSLLYDSGVRVQELADLTVGDLRYEKPATLKVTGKGGKTRIIPLMPQTANILKEYTHSLNKTVLGEPLFFNKNKQKLTRAGVTYILQKYIELARRSRCDLYPQKVTPHVLRRSKAMHLLEGGVNLIYIRDFLGHISVVTTEVYAKANPEIKRKAIESASIDVVPDEHYSDSQKQDLLDWLKEII